LLASDLRLSGGGQTGSQRDGNHGSYCMLHQGVLHCFRHDKPRALIAQQAARCSVPQLSFDANTEPREVQYWKT
jgi:hypothetical protein